jgi:PAS domain-containing protein
MDDKQSSRFEGDIPPFVMLVASSLVLVLFTCLLRLRAGGAAAVSVPRRTFESWSVAALQTLGVTLIATDVEGRITGRNEVAESLTGWTKDRADRLRHRRRRPQLP